MDYLFATLLGTAAALAIMILIVGIYDAIQDAKENAENQRRMNNGREDRGNTKQNS